jgi:hypothetical protein
MSMKAINGSEFIKMLEEGFDVIYVIELASLRLSCFGRISVRIFCFLLI